MKFLSAFSRWVNKLNERVGLLTTWCTLFMVVMTVIDVMLRYWFKAGSVAVQELEWHMFGFIFLLGAAYTLLHNEHVRVDIFYSRMSALGKAWVNLFGALFFCVPLSVLIIWTSVPFALSSWQFLEGSPDPGGLPARYILKTAIPVGFFLVGLQGLSMAADSLLRILEGRGDDEGDED